MEWDARAEERFAGLGRAPRAARRPRRARGPARRRSRLHGPRLPARHARARRHPAGRLRARAVPAVQPRLRAVVRDLRQRHALRARRADPRLHARRGRPAAPARPHRPDARRPPAPLRAPHRPARAAAGMGLRLLEVARRLPAPGGRRGGRPRLPLARHRRSTRSSSTRRGRRNTTRGSPTRTSSRTSPGWSRAGARPACARSCGSRRGSTSSRSTARSRPIRARGACTASRRPTTSRERFVRGADGEPLRRALVDGHRLDGRLHRPRERGVVARAGRARAAPGRGGHQGRRRRGLLRRRGPALRRRHDRRADRVALRRPVPRARCSARSTRPTAPGAACSSGAAAGAASRPPACCGRATRRRTSGRCARSCRCTIAAAGSGFSNWSHDVGGYLGHRGCRALPEGAAAALGPARLLHGAHAGPRPARAGAVDLRPRDARRSTAATCCCTRCSTPTCAPPRPAPRAAGRRSCAPPRCWTPAAGRSPMPSASGLRCGSRRSSRRARASARHGCRRASGSRRGRARACAAGARWRRRRRCTRIPVWVRAGAIVVTHPADAVRAGLGEGDAPLHATLWGEPRCGRALARLADGTVVRWRRGRWSAARPGRRDLRRALTVRHRGHPAGHGSSRGTYSFARKCRQIQGCVPSSASRPPSCAPARCARWAARASRRTTR